MTSCRAKPATTSCQATRPDSLNGGFDNDVLVGGLGRDVMTGGGGLERFDFNSVSESLPGLFNRDVITDFVGNGIFAGDVIDVSTIDANVLLPGIRRSTLSGRRRSPHPVSCAIPAACCRGVRTRILFSELEIQLTGAPVVIPGLRPRPVRVRTTRQGRKGA